MKQVQTTNDWTGWVYFFIKSFNEIANSAYKKLNAISDISKDERSNSDWPKGEIIRLARRLNDITKIWDDIALNKDLVISMILQEKDNVRVNNLLSQLCLW